MINSSNSNLQTPDISQKWPLTAEAHDKWCQEKKGRALDSCFGLISPHQQSILHPYLQAPRVYKGQQWRCNCYYEMRFIPTRLCHCYALIHHPSIHGLEPRLHPTPAGQRPVRAETSIQKADMMGWAAAMKPASTHTLPVHHLINNPCGAKRKRAELWTAVSGLLALISRAYCTPISRHHEFVKGNNGAAIVVMK